MTVPIALVLRHIPQERPGKPRGSDLPSARNSTLDQCHPQTVTCHLPVGSHSCPDSSGGAVDFGYDARTEELRGSLLAFMDSHVYPAERIFADQVAEAEAAGKIWQRPAVIAELKAQARLPGLWNPFLTVPTPKHQIREITETHAHERTN